MLISNDQNSVVFLPFDRYSDKTLIMLLLSIPAKLIYFGLQHYLSLVGSLVFIPLIIVPAMGGTDVRFSSSLNP